MKKTPEILIKGGMICDGTGSEPFEADIGISGERIIFIDRSARRKRDASGASVRVVEARDMTVTPGFIDTHAHSEFTLLADPRAEGKICQGITTEINGNCGLSAAPLSGEALKQREEDLRGYDIRERWRTFGEYFGLLEKRNISMNYATLVGHGNIRACVAGYSARSLERAEKQRIRTLLRKSLDEGAIGLSTGLIYPPGVYSGTEELVDLAKCCKALIYTSHMRSEGDRLLESIEELIGIARESGIRGHISHIKTSGQKNWHKIDSAISMIELAQKEGVCLTCDRYPYTAASTDLDTVLPSWVYEGGADREIRQLKKAEVRSRIRSEILKEHGGTGYWETICIAAVAKERNRWMEGKTLAFIAERKKAHPVDVLMHLLIEEKLRVSAIFSSMNEQNLRRFLSLQYCMIGTDGSARSADGVTRIGKPHPRGFGSFPRFIGEYVREHSVATLSGAVQRITALPANTFGIFQRGVLREGAFADIVIFDYKQIRDRATFDKPFLKPEGIHYVFVNGIPAVWEGRLTGRRGGRVLRHGGLKATERKH